MEKWKLENEKAIRTALWLQNDKAADRCHVSALRCSVCVKFEESIRSCRNFNPAFIHGSTNLRESSFKEHARTDMHARAMLLLRKEQASDVTEYAPIARALTTLNREIFVFTKFRISNFRVQIFSDTSGPSENLTTTTY